MDWFYALNNEQRGPVSEAEFEQLQRTGVIQAGTLVWREGMAQWQTFASVQPPPPPNSIVCAQCGRAFSPNEIVRIGEAAVCAGCKPLFLQRLREGVSVAAPAPLRYAGFWVRAGAFLVDGIIGWCVGVGVGLVGGQTFLEATGFGSGHNRPAPEHVDHDGRADAAARFLEARDDVAGVELHGLVRAELPRLLQPFRVAADRDDALSSEQSCALERDHPGRARGAEDQHAVSRAHSRARDGAPAGNARDAERRGEPEVRVVRNRNQAAGLDGRAFGERAVSGYAGAVAKEPGAGAVGLLDDGLGARDVRKRRMSAVESAGSHREVERVERGRTYAQRGALVRREGLINFVQQRKVTESMDSRGPHWLDG